MGKKKSIFRRFISLFRANANAALDAVEDPALMIEQQIIDYTNNIQKAEVAIAEVIGHTRAKESDQSRRLVEAESMGLKAQKAASLSDAAAQKGDAAEANRYEALARKALEAQLRSEKEHQRVATELVSENEQAEKLKESLDSMKKGLSALRDKRNELVARQKSAEASNKIYESLGSISTSDPTSELRAFEEKVRRSEALVAGREELAKSSLEAQFASLDGMGEDSEVESRLSALKSGGRQSIEPPRSVGQAYTDSEIEAQLAELSPARARKLR